MKKVNSFRKIFDNKFNVNVAADNAFSDLFRHILYMSQTFFRNAQTYVKHILHMFEMSQTC